MSFTSIIKSQLSNKKNILVNSGYHTFLRSMTTARAIVYNSYGDPQEELKCHSYELPDAKDLKDNQVLLQSLACPLNPSDINQIQGVYPSKPAISLESLPALKTASAVTGNEGVFKVIAVGPNVKSLEVNDWCIPSSVNFGTWCTHRLTLDDQLMKMPKTITVTQAATIAVNPSSAYQMLTYFEKLEKGDWFIQNGGNSQVGRAAIQIAKKLGFNSISIVRNRDNLDELVSELKKLGATHVITEEQSGSKEFGKTVKQWLNGKQIRLGLNCIGGSSVTNLSRKLGTDATLLTYGGMSMKPVALPTSLFIFKNLTAKGFWVTGNIKRFPNSRQDTIKEIIKFMEDGDLVDAKYHENLVKLDSTSNDEFLNLFKTALVNSKKGKQLVVFN